MLINTIEATVRPPVPPRSALTDALHLASVAYAETARDSFAGVTAGLLTNDDVMLSALGEQIATLARDLAELPSLCNFVDARPDRSEMVEHLSEIAIDALGGATGGVVRAHARIFAV